MKLHDCEAIEIESVEEVSIGLEVSMQLPLDLQEISKKFPREIHDIP